MIVMGSLVALVALLAVLAAPAAALAETSVADNDDCARIQNAVTSLAQAERREAENLHLLAHGAALPIVEGGLEKVLERTSALRGLLREVRLKPVAAQPEVANCVTQGYRALYEAERLSSDLEGVVMELRGYPLAAPGTLARGG
jgi:hypothetical protein